MISSVRGTVLHVGLDHVVLETASGLGLKVLVTPETAAGVRTGGETTLFTELVVREDSMTLFGFPSREARDLFVTLQSVSGVGPRLALGMLAVFEPARLATTLASGDVTGLTKVPGIGRKSAERLVLELKDKVAAIALASEGSPAPEPAADAVTETQAQVAQALVGLGWAAKQAEATVARVGGTMPDASVSELLRASLRELGR